MASPINLLLRLSKFAVGKLPQGGPQKLEAIMGSVSEHLKSLNVPQAAIDRIQTLGKSILKKGEGLPKSVQALAGGADNAKAIEETLGLARAAWRGVKPAEMKKQFNTLLQGLEQGGVSKKVVDELRKLGPEQLSKIGAGQTLSAFERVGPDPFITQMYSKVLKKPFTSKAHNEALREVLGPATEKVTQGTKKALTEAGLPSFTGSGIGREVAGAIGGYSTTGAAVGIGLPAMFTMGGRGGGDQLAPNDARMAAVQGFQQLGATSSAEQLTNISRQQEMAARRQMVLQSHDPELFSRVLNVLAMPENRGTITPSERALGAGAQQAMPARRPDKDVKFLLDQLMSEASAF